MTGGSSGGTHPGAGRRNRPPPRPTTYVRTSPHGRHAVGVQPIAIRSRRVGCATRWVRNDGNEWWLDRCRATTWLVAVAGRRSFRHGGSGLSGAAVQRVPTRRESRRSRRRGTPCRGIRANRRSATRRGTLPRNAAIARAAYLWDREFYVPSRASRAASSSRGSTCLAAAEGFRLAAAGALALRCSGRRARA